VALASYSDLKASIADWLARNDLTTQIADFIALAEARINREIRCREQVAVDIGTISTQTFEIPPDFLETVMLTLDTTSANPLEYRPIEDSQKREGAEISGEPRWFSILGENVYLFPAPDSFYTYSLSYYAKVPALSDSAPTNWLLTKAPDVYLFAALKEGSGHLFDVQAEMAWDAKYRAAMDALHAAESRTKRTSGPYRARVLI
jgi:hypothetical protein